MAPPAELLIMRDTLNARIDLLNPRSSRTPTDSPTAWFSTALEDPLSDQDLSGVGLAAQPGREVGDAADRRVVEPSFIADAAQGREALGYADAEAEIVAESAPAVGQCSHSVTHSQRHLYGSSCGLIEGIGSLKNTISPSPGEALQSSLVTEDQLAERSVVLLEHRHHLFRLTRLSERRESSQIAEDHDDLATVTPRNESSPELITSSATWGERNRRSRFIRCRSSNCVCTRASSSAFHSSQLSRLPGDGVVVPLDPSQRRHSGQQLALVERFADEVVGSSLDSPRLLVVSARGDHDDRKKRRTRLAADPSAHLVAVDAGHHDVQEHQIDIRRMQQLECLLTGRCGDHPVALWGKNGFQEAQVCRLDRPPPVWLLVQSSADRSGQELAELAREITQR